MSTEIQEYFLEFHFSPKKPDNLGMEGVTVSEIAKETGLKPKTVLNRLRTLGIKPLTKEALYDGSALKAVLEMRPVGRPRKPRP